MFKKYKDLYDKFNHEEYSFIFLHLHKLFETQELKKAYVSYVREYEIFKSWLADKIITLFNENMDQWEKDNQCFRLKPGELLTIFKGKEVVIPLLKPEWAKQLVNWTYWAQLTPEFENQILQILTKVDSKATITDVSTG